MKAISHTRRACIHVAARVALGLGFVFGNTGLCAQSIDALQLVTKIPLGVVVGRKLVCWQPAGKLSACHR